MTSRRKQSKKKKKREKLLIRINKRKKARRQRLNAKKLKKDIYDLTYIFNKFDIDPIDQIIENIFISNNSDI